MIARNVWVADLESALKKTNEVFDGNIEWRGGPPTPVGKTRQFGSFRFTLTVKDCHKRGGRYGFMRLKNGARRHIGGAACWHAHGLFFDNLLTIAPSAVIIAGSSLANPRVPTRITQEGGNWEDWQIGSMADPLMFSEACDCEDSGLADEIDTQHRRIR